jgi:hypothetical protein
LKADFGRLFYFDSIFMRDHYQVLGLPATASASQIKAAYRKLVQQYHPDINPSPQAHTLIQEINEAYDVLGDFDKRTIYDNQCNGVYVTLEPDPSPTAQHRDPAYRRARRTGPVQESAQEILMKKCLPFILKLSWIGCFTCLVLFIDRVWPSHVEATEIRSFFNERAGRTTINYIITTEGRYLKISGDDWAYVEVGQAFEFIESGFLRIIVGIWLPESGRTLTNLSTVYRNYTFVPLILLIVSVLGVMPFKSVEMRFNIGIMLVFVLIFTWVLMFK